MNKKLIDVIATILLFIGMSLAFLPHAFHAKVGFNESSHLKHVISGMVLVVAALAVLVHSNNALKR